MLRLALVLLATPAVSAGMTTEPAPAVAKDVAGPVVIPPLPRSDPRNWATTNDLTADMARRKLRGIVGFALQIGPDGGVAGCKVTATSGHAELDELTCALLTRRAHFVPARDGAGRPTSGLYSGRWRWM